MFSGKGPPLNELIGRVLTLAVNRQRYIVTIGWVLFCRVCLWTTKAAANAQARTGTL